MEQTSLIKDIYDLTRFPLGIMAAIAGLTAGGIVVRIAHPEQDVINLLIQYWQLAVLGLTVPFLIICASMAINDYHDYEADRINNRLDRPLVRNPNLSPNTVLLGSLLMISIGIIMSFFLFYENPLVTFGVIVFSFLSISYNLWTKEKGLIGNMTVAACNTAPYLLALAAMGAIEGDYDINTTLLVFIMSGVTFFGVVGRELIKGIMDIEGDKAVNSKTFAVNYGAKNAVVLAAIFFGIVALLSPFPLFLDTGFNRFPANISYSIFMILTLIILFYSIYILYRDQSVEMGKKGRNYTKIALWTGVLAFLTSAFILVP